MKDFRTYLNEGKLGDCFEAAGQTMLNAKLSNKNLKMVHALVRGHPLSDLKGRRYAHAFNLDGDVVYDNSNGRNSVLRRSEYYKIGGIKPKEKGAYVEYTVEETCIKAMRNKHWGPWDLNMSLEEELPDEKKELGKKRLRISPKMLKIAKDKLD